MSKTRVVIAIFLGICAFIVVASGFCQQFLAKFGRLPTRKDVPSNPPGLTEMLTQKKVITVLMSPEEMATRIREAIKAADATVPAPVEDCDGKGGSPLN